MGAPTIFWSYDGSTVSVGTRSYTDREVSVATTWTSSYVIYNTDTGTNASNCSIYLADVQGAHVGDENVALSFDGTAVSWYSTDTTNDFPDLLSNGQVGQTSEVLEESVRVETDDIVGRREWSKNITYQYA